MVTKHIAQVYNTNESDSHLAIKYIRKTKTHVYQHFLRYSLKTMLICEIQLKEYFSEFVEPTLVNTQITTYSENYN